MERIHPEQIQSEYNREQNREQNVRQSKIKFRLVFFIYKLLIFCLAMNIIFCIYVISKNKDYIQIIYFGTLEVILMIIIIICLLYQYSQFIEAENNVRFMNEQTQPEIYANSLLYQSTLQYVIAYINQSKYLWIKIILLYSFLSILMLIVQIYNSQLSVCMCYDSIKDQYNEFNYSELKCLLEKDCRIEEFETISFPYLKQVTLINLPIIIILMVLEFAYVMIIPFICCFKKFIIKKYQYTYNYIQKQNAISFGSFLSGSIIFYSLSKLIALSLLMILTLNESCYVLVSSNIFYHLMIIIVFNQIKYIINYKKPKEEFCYKNSQILIDSILLMRNYKNGMFRVALILCLIFTSVGQLIYKRHKKYSDIINYDVYIEFDCGIFQFIMLILLIYKYIIFQQFNKKGQIVFNEFYSGSNQELSTNQSSIQNQSTFFNSRVQTDPNNATTIVRQQGNLLKQLKCVSKDQQIQKDCQEIKSSPTACQDIQSSSTECQICLESIEEEQNTFVQLECHHLHKFHIACIKQWINHQRLCPICREPIVIN